MEIEGSVALVTGANRGIGRDVLLEVSDSRGTGDGKHHRGAAQQPGEREL